jgi:hypothetical protein
MIGWKKVTICSNCLNLRSFYCFRDYRHGISKIISSYIDVE